MEEAFEIHRPLEIISENTLIDGKNGKMDSILSQIQKWENGKLDSDDVDVIKEYCHFDVNSMFLILKDGYESFIDLS